MMLFFRNCQCRAIARHSFLHRPGGTNWDGWDLPPPIFAEHFLYLKKVFVETRAMLYIVLNLLLIYLKLMVPTSLQTVSPGLFQNEKLTFYLLAKFSDRTKYRELLVH